MKSKDILNLVFFYINLLLFFAIFVSFFFDFYAVEGVKSDLFTIIKTGFDQFGYYAKYNGGQMYLQTLAATNFVIVIFIIFLFGLIIFNFIKFLKENPYIYGDITVDGEYVGYTGGASIALVAVILQAHWFMLANNGSLYNLGPGSIILLCAALLCIASESLLNHLTSTKKSHPVNIVIFVLYELITLSFAVISIFMLPRLFNFDNGIMTAENANFCFMNNYILSTFGSSEEGIDSFRMIGTWFMTVLLCGYIFITTVHVNIDPEKVSTIGSVLLAGLYLAYLATADVLNYANHTMAIITAVLLVIPLLCTAFIKYLLDYKTKKGI